MAKVTKVCRVCGKAYEVCQTSKMTNTFRWQEVSCSPECGAEYLRRIKLSRDGCYVTHPIMYNEDVYGFDGEFDDEYANGFGADE